MGNNMHKVNNEERRIARDSAYKLVYEYLFQQRYNAASLAIFTSEDLSEREKNYIADVYNGVIAHFAEFKELIKKYSAKFSFDRIFKADLASLMVAIYEMKYIDEIPLSVSINEAVELSKTYSTEKSNQFVNGVLSSIYKEITAEKGENGNV